MYSTSYHQNKLLLFGRIHAIDPSLHCVDDDAALGMDQRPRGVSRSYGRDDFPYKRSNRSNKRIENEENEEHIDNQWTARL